MSDFKEPLIPKDAQDTDRTNEKAEIVTREVATELNTELLQSIDHKLDLLLAAAETEV